MKDDLPEIPQSPDSERAVIGAMLLDPSLVAKVRERLRPSHFFCDSHREPYEAALALDERGVKLDPLQLIEELRRRGTLDTIGGPAFIASEFIGGLPSQIDGHIGRVVEAAIKRKAWVMAQRLAEAANGNQSVEEIEAQIRNGLAELERLHAPKEDHATNTLATSWANFDAEEFPQGERIAFAVERGEAALVNALPNAGKTTLSLNTAIALAAGRVFPPMVTEVRPRRVLYTDGETRRARLQRDLRTMTAKFSREEAVAVGQNLHLICEAEINGESLSLTRADHWPAFLKEAMRIKPDFIVIDTMSSLCPVRNENDNSEQQCRIWQPIQKLARDCNAAILVLHHVGKKSEDGQTPESVYRGRGASAAGGAARAVWLLIPDTMPGFSTLRCVKAKGDLPKETRLQLGENRWFTPFAVEVPKPLTALERVLQVVTREMRKAEIETVMKPDFSTRIVEKALAEAVELGKLKTVKRGVYQPASALSASSAKRSCAESAESAESPENNHKTPLPHFPHLPKGGAESAETTTANEGNDLEEFSQNGKKGPCGNSAEAKKAQSGVPHFPHPPMASAESAETPKAKRKVVRI